MTGTIEVREAQFGAWRVRPCEGFTMTVSNGPEAGRMVFLCRRWIAWSWRRVRAADHRRLRARIRHHERHCTVCKKARKKIREECRA